MTEVLFVVLPDTLLLDLAGPAETLRLANQALQRGGAAPAFRLRFVAPQERLPSSVGLDLAGLEPLPAVLAAGSRVVLLGRTGSAGDVVRRQRPWLATRDWLARTVAPALGDVSLATVCAGALLAADAGLVGTRRVTTHHELLDDLARLAPAAQVQDNRVFVEDGPLLSSAGITAGIDLALHLVARHGGTALASAVARTMVAYTRRGPHDPQRSPLLARRDHLHPAVHRAQDAVCAAPDADWSAERLAAAAHVTPRHLGRLFRQHVGLTPRDWVEQVRSELARHALERGAGPAEAATLAGLGSTRRLRRALARQAVPSETRAP